MHAVLLVLMAVLSTSLLVPTTALAGLPAHRNYTEADGLPSAHVYCVMQDHQGFIWLATEAGVSRFDGYTFTNFTLASGLPDNEVFSLHEDSQHRIWMLGSNGRLSYYKNGQFHNSTNDSLLQKLDWGAYYLSFFEDSKGTVWLGNQAFGLVRIDADGTLTTWYDKVEWPYTAVHALFEIEDSVYAHTPRGLVNVSHPDLQLTSRIPPLSELALRSTMSPNQEVIGITPNGTFKAALDGRGWHQQLLPGQAQRALAMVVRDDSTTWWCTNEGLVIEHSELPYTGQRFETLIANTPISSAMQDREGNIWAASLGGGVFVIPALNMDHYGTEEGLLSDEITAIMQARDGTVWAGDAVGNYYHIVDGQVEAFSTGDVGFSNRKRVLQIFEAADGTLWLPCDHSVVSIPLEGTGSRYLIAGVKSIGEAFDGTLVGTAHNGLLAIEELDELRIPINEKPKALLKQQPGVHTRFVEATDAKPYCMLFASNKETWVGTNIGLLRKQGGELLPWKPEHPALQVRITELLEAPDGSVWLGTNGMGVVHVQNDSILLLTAQQGLPSDQVRGLALDKRNRLWIATPKGLGLASPENQYATARSITTEDGLASQTVNAVVPIGDAIWVATARGISVFNVDELTLSDTDPLVHLTAVSVEGKPTAPHQALNLPYDQNYVRIRFVGLSYESDKSIEYRYRLNGKDTTWQTTTAREVEFASLEPGNYTFEVWATSQHGTESASAATLALTIRPPFWRAWWFASLLCFVLVASVYVFFRIRVVTYNRDVVRELLQLLLARFRKRNYYVIQNRGKTVPVPIEQILYCQSSGNYIEIHTTGRKYLVRATFKALESDLGAKGEFLRVHRSYLVHLERLTSFNRSVLTLADQEVPIGKSYVDEVHAQLKKRIEERPSLRKRLKRSLAGLENG